MSGGADSLSMLAPVGDATLRGAAARRSAVGSGGRTLQRGRPARLAPAARADPRRCTRAGKVTVIPAIGYDHPNQSHFTSRHYWEVGELNPVGRVGWMGRYLDRHGAADNPLQGLSLDYSLAPALAAGTVPVAAVGSPESYRLWTRDVWNIEARRRRPLRRARRDPDERPGARRRAQRGAPDDRAAGAAAAALHAQPGVGAARLATRTSTFARRLAVLAEMLTMGLPLRCVALDANGGYDTHDGQAASLPGMLGAVRAARSPPSRPTSRRAGSPTACSCTCGREFGRRAAAERHGHRPRRGRPLVPDRHAGQGHDDRRVPRPGHARRAGQPAQHERLPPRLQARRRRTGWASTRPGSSPTRRSSRRRSRCSSEARRPARWRRSLALRVRGGRGRRAAAQEAPQAAREGRRGQRSCGCPGALTRVPPGRPAGPGPRPTPPCRAPGAPGDPPPLPPPPPPPVRLGARACRSRATTRIPTRCGSRSRARRVLAGDGEDHVQQRLRPGPAQPRARGAGRRRVVFDELPKGEVAARSRAAREGTWKVYCALDGPRGQGHAGDADGRGRLTRFPLGAGRDPDSVSTVF